MKAMAESAGYPPEPAAPVGLEPIKESAVTVPPVAQWGLAPSFWAHVPLLAADMAELQPVPGMAGSFTLHGQPMRRVEVVGVVVELDCRDKYARFAVDDGSGLVPAILWLQPNAGGSEGLENTQQAVTAEVERAFAVRAAHEVQLGCLVRVQGRLTQFKETRQVTVDSLQVEANANAEVLHWLDCIRMKKQWKHHRPAK